LTKGLIRYTAGVDCKACCCKPDLHFRTFAAVLTALILVSAHRARYKEGRKEVMPPVSEWCKSPRHTHPHDSPPSCKSASNTMNLLTFT
jgi:hypothetical protein